MSSSKGRRLAARDDDDESMPIATNTALEAAIDAAPEKEENWLVYGDFLQSKGEPRGELIALHAKGESAAGEAEAFIAEHERYLLGGLLAHDEESASENLDAPFSYDWRLGFLHTARVMVLRAHEDAGIKQAPIVRTLLRLPSARFLHGLTLGCPSVHEDNVDKEVLAALVEAGPRPTLRKLDFETDTGEEMLSWTQTGDLTPLWNLYPRLTSLRIHAGSFELGEIDLPDIEDMTFKTCQLTTENAQSIANAEWPKLKDLDLWFGSIRRGATASVADIVPILFGESMPTLRRLGLVNAEIIDDICEELASASFPLLSRIQTLDLSRGTMTDAGAKALASALRKARSSSASSPSIRTLDVSENFLTEDGFALLSEIGIPNIVADEQRDEDTYEGEIYRYCATGE